MRLITSLISEITAEVFKLTTPSEGFVALYSAASTSKGVTGRVYRSAEDTGKNFFFFTSRISMGTSFLEERSHETFEFSVDGFEKVPSFRLNLFPGEFPREDSTK